jgi:large conductance mechanosensitive channel
VVSTETIREYRMLAGFKKFITQGNVIDLAVGVIIGAAFGTVVASLTHNVITPIIGAIVGKPNFDALTFSIGDGVVAYGAFLTDLLNFVLIAAAVYFAIVMPINALNERRKRGEEPADEKSNEDKMVELLERIANK